MNQRFWAFGLYPLLLGGLLLFGGGLCLSAQDLQLSQAEQTVFRAYLEGDADAWGRTVDQEYARWQREGSQVREHLFRLAVLEYGYIGLCQQENRELDTEARLDRLAGWLAQLEAADIRKGAATALLGGVSAMRIEVDGWNTISLGLRSRELIEQAALLAPDDPIVWTEMGNLRFHAPRLFGGSKEAAIEAYAKALSLYSRQSTSQNWMWLHTSAWLAQGYALRGQYSQAESIYRELLDRYPRFVWVKEDLLPGLQRKMR